MDPNVNRGESQECLETCGDALPADDQATVFLLKPGKGPLGLEPWNHLCDGPTPIFLGLPDALRALGPDPPLPELLAQRFRIIAFIRGDDAQPFAGTAPFARADLDGIKQRQHLRPLVPIGWRGAVGQRHAAALGQAVDQNPFAFPPAGDALAPTLARGKTRRQRRHTPNESYRVLPQCRESVLASPRACHPPASAATNDAWRFLTPTVARTAHHTSDSR